MMNKNVIKTKKRLTIIFTVTVFLVILLLGFTFFSFKYYNDLRIEKRGFQNVIMAVESGVLKISNVIKQPNRRLDEGTGGSGIVRRKDFSRKELNPRGFMNHILIRGEHVASSNIKDIISEDFIADIFDTASFHDLGLNDGFIIKKIFTDEETLILFKKLKYPLSDYIYDILQFILINILFSSILYFIGLKFVNRAFVPVEENIKDMNEFVHNAGHEFKTPLSVIDSNVQLIKDTKKYDVEMLDEIKSEGKKLNSLIDSLVKLSDIDDISIVETVKIKPVVNEIVSDYKEKISKKKLKVIVNVDAEVSIKVDKNYLYILLSNLIGNAIKYNNQGGEINISYEGSYLSIKDNGIGIAQSDIGNIFDRFYKADSSRNSEGFGIGLSLVKKIADKYKWTITVDSKVGEGTSFKIKM